MTPGHDKALYLLPFDHRNSYVSGLFGFQRPLSESQREQVRDSKQLIYEGFLQAVAGAVPIESAGILVDEEFGSDILHDAHRRGFVTAVSIEQSGSDEFEFEYGADFFRHIETFDPTFAKVLVRYNPGGDSALNHRQAGRLRMISDHCRRSGRPFMFELLVPATPDQLVEMRQSKALYDRRLRPVVADRPLAAVGHGTGHG